MKLPAALVVEDEALIAMDIAHVLEDMGWNVLGPCETAAGALALLEQEHPQIAFLDVQLRGETSHDVLARLRDLGVPIVLVTAYADPSVAGPGFAGLPTLVKPCDYRVLRRIIDQHAGVSYHIDPDHRIVFLYGRGALKVDQVLDLQRRLHSDPDFDPHYRLLADYRAASRVQLDMERLAEVVANAPFAPTSRRAFVVKGAANVEVLERFRSLSADGRHGTVAVFEDYDLARLWIERI